MDQDDARLSEPVVEEARTSSSTEVQSDSAPPARRSEVPFAVAAQPVVQIIRFLGKYLPGFFVVKAAFGEAHFAATIAYTFSTLAVLGLDEALIGARSLGRGLYERLRRMHFVSGVAGSVAFAGTGVAVAAMLSTNHPGLLILLLILVPHVWFQTQVALPTALLVRHGRYRALFSIDLASVLALTATTLVAAVLGLASMSLVAGWYAGVLVSWILASRLARTIEIPDVPGDPLSGALAFGRRLAGANVMGYVTERAEILSVGARLSSAAVGVFEFAQHLSLPLVGFASNLGTRLLFPRLSQARREEGAAPLFSRALRHVLTVWVPPHVAIAVLAVPITSAFAPADYREGTAVLLGILPLVAAARCLEATAAAGLRAAGRGRSVLGLGVAEAVVLLACLFAAAGHGTREVAWAALAVRLVAAAAGLAITCRSLGLQARSCLRELAPAFLVVLAFTAIAFAGRELGLARIASPGTALVAGVVGASAAWVAVRLLLDRAAFLKDLRQVWALVSGSHHAQG
jgi:O-antigen/teichoic acid export membrane protein